MKTLYLVHLWKTLLFLLSHLCCSKNPKPTNCAKHLVSRLESSNQSIKILLNYFYTSILGMAPNFISNAQIPIFHANQILNPDKRLTRGPHLKNKRKALNSRLRLLKFLLCSKLLSKTKKTNYT